MLSPSCPHLRVQPLPVPARARAERCPACLAHHPACLTHCAQHTVTTDDGYVLLVERIPRRGSRDVVFFMHGVLDTSMTWVSGGGEGG